jgi:uncharacterized protein
MRYFCALMSGAPLERVGPWRACRRELVFAGDALLSAMPRLAAALAGSETTDASVDAGLEASTSDGAARYELRFGRDRQGRSVVLGRVRARLRLPCQRCLEAVEIPVDAPIALALIRRDEDALDLPEHLDPWLVTEDRLNPLDLVEDELLLAVPQIPRHPAGMCGPGLSAGDELEAPAADTDARSNATRRPFAILASLKRSPET